MYCFHFGHGAEKLYGALSPPASGGEVHPAVVLCYPFGQEQNRCHMAFRQLANLISRKGGGALRFDYFGTGDSSGELKDASFSRWVEDTRLAVEELKALSGVSRVSMVGLRLGAAVAAYAANGRNDIDDIVLWDPVMEGGTFLQEMERLRSVVEEGSWWIQGFPLSPGFRESLADLRFSPVTLPAGASVCQIQSQESSSLRRAWSLLETHRGGAERILVPGPGDWNYMDAVGGILLPQELVRTVSAWLTRER